MTASVRGHRVRRTLLAIGLVLATLGGLVPVATVTAASVTAGPAGAGYAFGSNPFDTILAAADANKKCGLSRDYLAALMIAPIYHEAGGSATVAPSPMTLSRWDTGSGLWYGSNKSTPYQKAFFHPGIGLWQFDSAGGWNLTAADAIDVEISAPVAAKTMADRFCNSNGSRSYVWGPWYGCGGNKCEVVFNTIFNGTSLNLSQLSLTNTVGNRGGMVTRSCTLGGVSVTCSYVNPAAAQGNRSWTLSGPPTPLSAPFYVIRHQNREWRVWLPADTGYAVTISANKAVTANARTGLAWSTSTQLCDTTASRGSCGRVASTPWGPKTADPFGSFDEAAGGMESGTVRGWAIDPDTNDPVTVHLYVDGAMKASTVADVSRPDVAAAVPGYGQNHGFAADLTGIPAGSRQICAYALNLGPFGTANPLLGCKTITVTPIPPGPFKDVNGIHPFVGEIRWLVDQGIAQGYADGSFHPTEAVSRGAMAVFLWRMAGQPAASPAAPGFTDVPAGHVFAPAIRWLAGAGITTGFGDGTFRSTSTISREAMAAFLYRFAGQPRGVGPSCPTAPFSDVGTTATFCGEIRWLVDTKIATGFGDGTFRPRDIVSRQAAAAFLARIVGP